jgi:hypothetical protein
MIIYAVPFFAIAGAVVPNFGPDFTPSTEVSL